MANDEKILLLLKDKSTHDEAFKLILSQYKERIYFHIRKMVISHEDADDVTQDVFIKIWKNLDKFRGDSHLYTWLYRIASNETYTFLRKNKKHQGQSLEENEELINHLESPKSNDYLSGDEISIKLQKAILKLPDKQRMIFNMKYFDDLKYEEISKITGTTVGGLKATYHLAVKKIQDLLNL